MTVDRIGRKRLAESRRAAVPMLALLAVLALVASGCGGSSSDTKANEAYANSVCTAVGTWEQQIKSIATDFSGGISKTSLQSKIAQADTATKTLATQVKGLVTTAQATVKSLQTAKGSLASAFKSTDSCKSLGG